MRRRARRNPIGLPLAPKPDLPLPPGTQAVRIGATGGHTHIWHPDKEVPICESGLGRSGGDQTYYASNARFATCYRCVKLGSMNLAAGRPVWKGPRDK